MNENVRIVQRSWEAYPSGGVDAMTEFWDGLIVGGREYETPAKARQAAGVEA